MILHKKWSTFRPKLTKLSVNQVARQLKGCFFLLIKWIIPFFVSSFYHGEFVISYAVFQVIH
jgi:hypothetical protein